MSLSDGHRNNARLAKVTLPGGGTVSKGEDGRIAVAGRESLRILRLLDPSAPGRQPKIESSRNLWEGSGLKIDCASTDVAWAYGVFNNKILTSARNGELIMWDLNKSGHSKYERKTKEHLRSIHAMTVSRVVHHYCMTGSADGDFRVWDLRDIQSSVMRVHNPSAVRRVIFSPCVWNPLFVLVGMDNGTLHRWDLKMGQKGLLDRLPVAHTAPITTMDWFCGSGGGDVSQGISISGSQGTEEYTGNTLGWFASAGLDRCAKIWNLTGPDATTHMPNKPTYILHTSYPIRRILWRPSYDCELAVVSHADFTAATHVEHMQPPPSATSAATAGLLSRVGSGLGIDTSSRNTNPETRSSKEIKPALEQTIPTLDAVEIWDVRRSWIPKWSVVGTSIEGGVTDIEFGDSQTLLTQNTNGTFTQLDLRDVTKPLDCFSRNTATWNPEGSVAFITDNIPHWEIPYDDNRTSTDGKVAKRKIGDLPYQPKTQRLGTYASSQVQYEASVFRKLACTYAIDGNDRSAICAFNMEAAKDVGKVHIAQVWSMMQVSLAKAIPDTPPTPPPSPPSIINQPATGTPSIVASHSLPPTPDIPRHQRQSPARASTNDAERTSSRFDYRSPSMSHSRGTPNSSNSSSPLHHSIGLPTSMTPRRPSFLGHRSSIESGARRSTLLRRQSMSVPGHSASPIDKTSAKNVGEGVLSDSDSSPGSDDEGDTDTIGMESAEEYTRHAFPAPSPLSRVVDQHQCTEDGNNKDEDEDEDDDDEASPSPRSTDSESDGELGKEGGMMVRKKQRRPSVVKLMRRNSTLTHKRVKSRSRSSTLASLAAIPIPNPNLQPQPHPTLPLPPRPLIHHNSESSIRTITAAETSFNLNQNQIQELPTTHREESSIRHHNRMKHGLNHNRDREWREELALVKDRFKPYWNVDVIVGHEASIRDHCWEMISEAFEEFLDIGDIQMCATMAVIARDELKLTSRKLLHIYDTYIEQMMQQKLFTSAAYFRKHSKIEQIKNMTLLDTTIHTTCGKCKKPIIRPVGRRTTTNTQDSSWKLPHFSECLRCKAPAAICTICRLPVRKMLFQCSICHHGGHQSCYRQYYLSEPMHNVPSSDLLLNEDRGRSYARSLMIGDGDVDIGGGGAAGGSGTGTGVKNGQRVTVGSGLAGHPCAAGCGHFCWATLPQVGQT